jgi:hypothetical protein
VTKSNLSRTRTHKKRGNRPPGSSYSGIKLNSRLVRQRRREAASGSEREQGRTEGGEQTGYVGVRAGLYCMFCMRWMDAAGWPWRHHADREQQARHELSLASCRVPPMIGDSMPLLVSDERASERASEVAWVRKNKQTRWMRGEEYTVLLHYHGGLGWGGGMHCMSQSHCMHACC